jgi:hypothetical protein
MSSSAEAWANPPADRFAIVVTDRCGAVTDGTVILREGAPREEWRIEVRRLMHEIFSYPDDYYGGNVSITLHFPDAQQAGV